MTIMVSEQVSSLVKILMVMLTVLNVVQGKTKQEHSDSISDNCPTQDNTKFPKSVMVDMHADHIESISRVYFNIRSRSLSPWNYSISEDPNRFPHMIAEANCRYQFCVKPKGQGFDNRLDSVPIQQEILVLKRKQNGCKQNFWLEKQKVTVGCTCVFPVATAYTTHGVRQRRGLTYRSKW